MKYPVLKCGCHYFQNWAMKQKKPLHHHKANKEITKSIIRMEINQTN